MEVASSEIAAVHSDGSSGKYGAAAASIVVLPKCANKIKIVGYLGEVDSLSAEQWGLLMGLLVVRLWSRKSGVEMGTIDCYSDSRVMLERFRLQAANRHLAVGNEGRNEQNPVVKETSVPRLVETGESVTMAELLGGWSVAVHKVRGHAKRATTQPERFNAACDRACSWILPLYCESKQSGQILSQGPIITFTSRSVENSWYFVDMQKAVTETSGYGIAEVLLAGVFQGAHKKVEAS